MFHKVKTVNVIPDYRLSIQFAEGVTKIYDLKPLFEKWPIFRNLKNDDTLLYSVEVDAGGYGIIWNDDIDLSCDELFDWAASRMFFSCDGSMTVVLISSAQEEKSISQVVLHPLTILFYNKLKKRRFDMDQMHKIDDYSLKKVNGGIAEAGGGEEAGSKKSKQLMLIACKHCKEPFEADVQKDSAICPHCGTINQFFG